MIVKLALTMVFSPRCFWIALLFTGIISVKTAAAGLLQDSPWRDCELINRGWQYFDAPASNSPPSKDATFVPVDLPHTWNAKDTLQHQNYRRGVSWYRKHLRVTQADMEQRLFLRFGAAGQQARVYVNGNLCGEHQGGYAAFTFEISDHLRPGENRIDVWVSNAEDLDLGPIDADFNFYGGLYRSVQLIRAPTMCFSRNTRGGPGVHVWSNEVSPELADLHTRVAVDNGTKEPRAVRLRAELLDSEGRVVSFAEELQEISGTEFIEMELPSVVDPQLWSPERPILYRLRVQLFEGTQTVDEVNVQHGFRWFRFTSAGIYYLNGQPYVLRGVNRHQDLQGYGNAVPSVHHERDIKLVKELGANWLRLAHYQQDDYVLDLCDRLGVLVWEEIPFVNILTDTPEFRENHETMLREMIEQHFNHPSIIMWGVQNEILLKQEGKLEQEKLALVRHLADVARQQDPRRAVVQAGHGSTRYGEIGLPAVSDVMGYNVYFGWYSGEPGDLTRNIESYRRLQPDTPLVISEYGADSDIRIHTDSPVRQDFSEEWQVHYLERYLDQFDEMPVCGTLWWNMFDFGASHRGNSIPHVNQKGLIAFDHETKKDAWYLLKSRWSKEPVLYLSSPHFTHRTGNPTKSFRVFTNFDEVELFHQGNSLGKQERDFRWEVVLVPGENYLEARGRKGRLHDRHGFVVTYSSAGDVPSVAQNPLNNQYEFSSPIPVMKAEAAR